MPTFAPYARDWSLFPTDGHYVVRKKFTIGGFDFEMGDFLPMGSSLRSMPRRLAQMVEQRYLMRVNDPALGKKE